MEEAPEKVGTTAELAAVAMEACLEEQACLVESAVTAKAKQQPHNCISR